MCKKVELDLFLQVNNIDVAAVSETKLMPKVKFNLQGYKVYRLDRNRFGGGVLLLVNSSLRHDTFTLTPMTGLEATSLSSSPKQLQTELRLRLPSTNSQSITDGPRSHFRISRCSQPHRRPQQ